MRELVDEALDAEDVLRVAHGTPRSNRHGRRNVDKVRSPIRYRVRYRLGRVVTARMCSSRAPVSTAARSGNAILPAHGPTAFIERGGETLHAHGSINVVLHVLFARPHDFDGRTDR